MHITCRTWALSALALAAALSSAQVFARNTVVKVSLWDKGANSMEQLGHGEMMGMAMGKAGNNMAMAPMGIRLSTRTVPAGEVTFEVTNASKSMVHEMIISPIKNETTPLPYDKATIRADEDAAGHLGEVSELEPGKSGTLKITLKPGRYILYCNVPGHYVLGMWTVLNVK